MRGAAVSESVGGDVEGGVKSDALAVLLTMMPRPTWIAKQHAECACGKTACASIAVRKYLLRIPSRLASTWLLQRVTDLDALPVTVSCIYQFTSRVGDMGSRGQWSSRDDYRCDVGY